MSPRPGQGNPIKKIKLKITLDADGPSLASVSRVLKGSRVSGDRLVSLSQTSDIAVAIETVARVGEALRAVPKDFK